jgi:hypothetical protein
MQCGSGDGDVWYLKEKIFALARQVGDVLDKHI